MASGKLAQTSTGEERSLKSPVRSSPLVGLLILSLAIFLTEFGVMFLLPYLPTLAPWQENLADSTLMLLLSFPILYRLVLRPLQQEIGERERAEAELRTQRDRLDSIVLERTIELKTSNAELTKSRDEMERRVEDRTAEIKSAMERLRSEFAVRQAAERALAESEERYRNLFESSPVAISLTDEAGVFLTVNQRMCDLLGGLPEEFAAGSQVTGVFADPEELGRLNQAVARDGKVEDWETSFRRKDGSVFPVLVQVHPVLLSNRKALMTIAQDLTRRRESEKRIEGTRDVLELFVSTESLTAYLDALARLLRDWCDCDHVGIRVIGEDGALSLSASAGILGLMPASENAAVTHECECACLRMIHGNPPPEDRAWVNFGGSFVCDNRHATEPAGPPVACRFAPGNSCLRSGFASLALSPLSYRGRTVGTIQLADRQAGRCSRETIDFIQSVSPLIGEAVHRFTVEASLHESELRFRSMFESNRAVMLLLDPETGAVVDANPAAAAFYGLPRESLCQMNLGRFGMRYAPDESGLGSRLSTELAEYLSASGHLPLGERRSVEVHSSPIAVNGRSLLFAIVHDVTERKHLQQRILEIAEEERQRVGRDLHDSLGGKLAGSALLAKAVAQSLVAKGHPEADVAKEVVQSINEAMAQTRGIAQGLCPVVIGEFGLVSGLRQYASEMQKIFGITCRVESEGSIPLWDEVVALHLLRIVQEAVNNAIRHGESKTIAIRFGVHDGRPVLEIQDDGVGLPADVKQSKGMGLRTMRYRAEIINAQLRVHGAPGGGTLVSCFLPADGVALQGKGVVSGL